MKLGKCSICNRTTIFWYVIKERNNYREDFRCVFCGRNSRQRALVSILKEVKPNYMNLVIHESSPSKNWIFKGKNNYINAVNYTYSYFYSQMNCGITIEGFTQKSGGGTNQNLEKLTFKDNSFDIFITQDVFEHINNPQIAFEEIKRVLRTGGVHILTIPQNDYYNTFRRIKINDQNEIAEYVQPKEYHRNPINQQGSLVTTSWGFDTIEILEQMTHMKCKAYLFHDKSPYIREQREKENQIIYVEKARKEGVLGGVVFIV